MNSVLAILLTVTSATLPGETGFMDAYNQVRLGRHANAMRLFHQVADTDPDLAPYAKIRAARSRARAGDPKGAITEIEAVLRDHPEGPWVRWAHHELAELFRKENSFTKAARHYEGATRSDVNLWWIDDIRLKQAENDLKIPGRQQEAMTYFRELLDTTRWYKKRLKAARALAKSKRAEDRIHAALALLRSNQYKDATRVSASIPKTWLKEPHLGRQWRHLSARLLIARGRKTEGRKQLEALALEYPKETWADKALLYTTISIIGAEQWNEADRLVEQLIRIYPDSDSSREGMLRIARAHAKYKHTDRAVEWYRKRVKLYPENSDTGTALLEAGNAYRSAKRDQEAIGMYDQLVNDFPQSSHAAEAGFWAGQLLKKNGQKALAKKRFQLSVTTGLTQYYGYRSQEILVTEFALPESEAPNLKTTPKVSFVRPIPQEGPTPKFAFDSLKDDVRFDRLKFFAHNGFLEAEWDSLPLMHEVKNHADPEFMYRALGEAGTTYSAMQWADALEFGVRDDGSQTIERLRIRYARPYWDYVDSLAKELDLDPYMILAIARQESTYRPGLKSSAGAKGIMQIMPRTAKWMGDTDKLVTRNTSQRLDEPQHSLRIGAVYFKRMLDRSKGDLVYALASYNAGPGNCDKWRKRHPNYSTSEFIEAIPFTETRNYVKRILAHYATYKSIYPE